MLWKPLATWCKCSLTCTVILTYIIFVRYYHQHACFTEYTCIILQVVLVIVLISGSVAEGEAYLVEEGTDSGRAIEANIAVGWTIFLALVAIIYELFFIICRLLNFQFMIEYRLVYLIVVSPHYLLHFIMNAIIYRMLLSISLSRSVSFLVVLDWQSERHM
jgi:hypothetical protein